MASGLAYIEGHARDQALLPASVEDYVSADNPGRFIDAFVDDLDLGGASFHRSQAKATERPSHDPGDLLKLYLHGYFNRTRSSCRLAADAVRDLEVSELLRGLWPELKTIADFLRDHRFAITAVSIGSPVPTIPALIPRITGAASVNGEFPHSLELFGRRLGIPHGLLKRQSRITASRLLTRIILKGRFQADRPERLYDPAFGNGAAVARIDYRF